jgi:hypothetical protein
MIRFMKSPLLHRNIARRRGEDFMCGKELRKKRKTSMRARPAAAAPR